MIESTVPRAALESQDDRRRALRRVRTDPADCEAHIRSALLTEGLDLKALAAQVRETFRSGFSSRRPDPNLRHPDTFWRCGGRAVTPPTARRTSGRRCSLQTSRPSPRRCECEDGRLLVNPVHAPVMDICQAYGAAPLIKSLDLKALAARVREHSETQTVF